MPDKLSSVTESFCHALGKIDIDANSSRGWSSPTPPYQRSYLLEEFFFSRLSWLTFVEDFSTAAHFYQLCLNTIYHKEPRQTSR